MGLGGGPQGSNLFPQAGRLTSSRKVDSEYAEGAFSSAGANGLLLNLRTLVSDVSLFRSRPPRHQTLSVDSEYAEGACPSAGANGHLLRRLGIAGKKT